MRDTSLDSSDYHSTARENPKAEDWSLPSKYREVFEEVEQMLAKFRNSSNKDKR